mgnify:CR=1 FL=1
MHFQRHVSRCSKLIAIKLCAISEMHAKVRRESVAGYATDETLVCGPKEHTRWWQRYRGHLQGLLYRLILNSYLLIKKAMPILIMDFIAASCSNDPEEAFIPGKQRRVCRRRLCCCLWKRQDCIGTEGKGIASSRTSGLQHPLPSTLIAKFKPGTINLKKA